MYKRQRYGSGQLAGWEAMIDGGDWPAFVRSILQVHYDPSYLRSEKYPAATHDIAIPDLSAPSIHDVCERILQATGTV